MLCQTPGFAENTVYSFSFSFNLHLLHCLILKTEIIVLNTAGERFLGLKAWLLKSSPDEL